jgi:hypothetical protein
VNWIRLVRLGSTTMLLTLLIAAAPLVAMRTAAQSSTPAAGSLLAELGYPTLAIATDGETSSVPTDVEAGRHHVALENTGELPIDLFFVEVPDGTSMEEVRAVVDEVNETGVWPPLLRELVIKGGTTAEPGQVGNVVLDLTPGEWLLAFLGYDEETDSTTSAFESLLVTGEMPQMSDPEGVPVVYLVDFAFVVPSGLQAGRQVVKVHSSGQGHHLVVFGVPEGTTEEDVLALFNQDQQDQATPDAGAAPVEAGLDFSDVVEVGYSSILSSGQANWIELDLTPGTYVAICFMPTPDGIPHVMLGMIDLFTVADA